MKSQHTLYLIEDDRDLAAGLKKMLEKQGFHPFVFHQAEDALKSLTQETPDIIISDVQLPGISGLELVRDLSSKYPRMPIILTTAFGTTDLAIEATKAGAYDFLEKPFEPAALVSLIRKAYQAFSLNVSRVALGEEKVAHHDSIIGKSPAMREIFKQIGRLAATPLTVVVRGETGTGKELVALALFQHSDRNQKPFLAVNCLAIPATLIESELFGHEKGAFTGAHMRRIGRFEQAQRGTLFLDEIGDLPLTTQGKLLRVLQEGVIQRLGSNMDIPIHTRVIAATHCDLERAVMQKTFREDLYYRLGAAEIRIPPLRQRVEDIRPLAEYFLNRFSVRLGALPPSITPSAIHLLEKQPWPGNIRELQNVIQKSLIECRGLPITDVIVQTSLYTPATISTVGQDPWKNWVDGRIKDSIEKNESGLAQHFQQEVERFLIQRVGEHTRWNKSNMAKLLGWSRPTLYQKLAAYHLTDDERVN